MVESAADWRALRTDDDSLTLVHPRHGQACHSRAGAWTEACERYADVCRLGPRARIGGEGCVLRLLDVGTGLGLNLAAALEALAGTGASLEVCTLERDVVVIERTLELVAQGIRIVPVAVQESHARVLEALREALARPSGSEVALGGGAGTLRLLRGDARQTLPGLGSATQASGCFDAVFLDPFSPAVEPELRSPGFLGEVARRMAPGSLLSTYSVSPAVRAGLLAAGLRIGAGPRVGTKAAGTLASPDLALRPIDARIQAKLERRALRILAAGPLRSR